MNEQLAELLAFWFGESRAKPEAISDRMDFWFQGSPRDDAELRARFGKLHAGAIRGALYRWPASPPGRLGLILLLDQLPRCLERGTPGAFAWDDRASSLCLAGILQGADRQLSAIERVFFYLPLQHSEDLAAQEAGVDAYRRLVDGQTDYRERFESFLDYARLHHDIIARFGRFPHRNWILGRQSTAEETRYLESGAPTFGQ